MYTQKTLDIFKNPQNAGGLQGANGVGKVVDATFGDVIKFYLKIDEKEVIEQARFKTMGGVVSIAASSLVTELVKGLSLKDAKELDEGNILEVLEQVSQEKFCLLTSTIEALNEAIEDYYKRKEKEEKEAKEKKSK
jgi:nitrogen fixation NifU-like protein